MRRERKYTHTQTFTFTFTQLYTSNVNNEKAIFIRYFFFGNTRGETTRTQSKDNNNNN